MPAYLDIINNEMARIRKVLQDQKNAIMRSVDKIVAECLSSDKKLETYREILEVEF